MSLSAVLLLLLHLTVCNSQNISFLPSNLELGFVGAFNFYTKEKYVNDSSSLTIRLMWNSQNCTPDFSFGCQESSCGYVSILVRMVDQVSGEWCQNELRTVQPSPINVVGSLGFPGFNWVSGIKNNIGSWVTAVAFDLRNRSDTNKENSSPQSTVIPFVRVPSNCRRDFSPLMFDPDGDQVKCRYENSSLFECNACDPPSVLSLSSSTCTLSFGPTADSNVGPYGVQLLMEDFPRKNITMTGVNGTKTTQTPNDALSKVPIQFVLIVDPPVSSCTEGDFLPKFLPPTPANRARLYTPVNNTLEISISAEAKNSTISELLFSGPYDAVQNKTGPGTFTLRWTPSKSQDNDTLPFCFVVQALSKETKYHSDLRCVSVTVGNGAPAIASAFVLVMGSFLSTLILAFPSI